MTLSEAIESFLDSARRTDTSFHSYALAIKLLTTYLSHSGAGALADITARMVRDFLARWYVEESSNATGDNVSDINPIARPQELLNAMQGFLRWVDERAATRLAAECEPVIAELSETLPRTLEICHLLSRHLARRGGAFGFPEFLTSFEEGGRSQYDIDRGGDVGALESYFRIERVEDSLVEAEDLISQERVWPILFPEDVARLISPGYIINLELIRAATGWRIVACGFAYPPNTEF